MSDVSLVTTSTDDLVQELLSRCEYGAVLLCRHDAGFQKVIRRGKGNGHHVIGLLSEALWLLNHVASNEEESTNEW